MRRTRKKGAPVLLSWPGPHPSPDSSERGIPAEEHLFPTKGALSCGLRAGDGDRVDLDADASRKRRHLNGAASWVRRAEEARVRLVDLGEMGEIDEVDRRPHDIVETEASGD